MNEEAENSTGQQTTLCDILINISHYWQIYKYVQYTDLLPLKICGILTF